MGEDDDEDDGSIGAVEKAATPAELAIDEENLQRHMARARPMTLVPQRDSDAQKNVEAAREHAMSTVASENTMASL